MKPTMEILERIRQNSKQHPEEVFTRLFRYMLRPDMYYVAYKKLYANNGAATKGVDDDTADGFSEEKVKGIIQSLADDTYLPKPVRRTYIRKANGKMRPLGIPTFTDKLVQEVLREILEAVYEPIFLNCSHGFRPGRSCQTALGEVKREFNGIRWFIEGDIKGCFDNINHNVLASLVSGKVRDARLIKLIYGFLKAGYMDNWLYHKTYSGTPQGGIISPLLANIYLHELDKYVMKLKADFDEPATRKYTPEYALADAKIRRVQRRLKKATGEERDYLIAQIKSLRAEKLRTPAKSQTDKKIKYIRYADDFIIGVCGGKEDCQHIKNLLSNFISQTLKMELSTEKTLITHSAEKARFLGYDISVRRNGKIKRKKKLNFTCRTLNNKTELLVPFEDKIQPFLFKHSVARQKEDGTLFPSKRTSLLNLTDFEIVQVFNAELRGICNFYGIASNFNKLTYFAYFMEYSCLMTLAAKHRSSISKIKAIYKDGKGKWGIPYETKSGKKRLMFAKYSDCKGAKDASDIMDNTARKHWSSTTSFESRLKAKECELCGTTQAQHYEIHHVNKVKNLKGKNQWETVMIAKRRKTIVVCRDCHKRIHAQ